MSLNAVRNEVVSEKNLGLYRFVDCEAQSNVDTKPSAKSAPVSSETVNAAPSKKVTDIDRALVKRTLDGDKKAFDLLVIKYQSNIANVISRYIQDFDTVKDVTQETFIRAYKALKSYRFESQFYTWLYRIAVNTSYNYLKSNKGWLTKVKMFEETTVFEQKASKVAEPERSNSNEDLKSSIYLAVNELPMELRTVLLLRERDGLTYEQIAEIVGCELGTVKSRIFRAREKVIEKTSHLYEPELLN